MIPEVRLLLSMNQRETRLALVQEIEGIQTNEQIGP